MDEAKPMKILSIDPGNKLSAYVIYEDGEIIDKGKLPNEELLFIVGHNDPTVEHMVIEMIASYGMAVGETVFETCVWIGRFIERWNRPFTKVKRMKVKMHLCHSARAKDCNIRQAIIDRYPETGGGKTQQIGTKSQPGPLYGVSADVWAALGVAITFSEGGHLIGATK